jgi:hypothetical protein
LIECAILFFDFCSSFSKFEERKLTQVSSWKTVGEETASGVDLIKVGHKG